MESMEAAARPILIPILNSDPVSLEVAALDTLAQWATLRVMIAQHAHPLERRRSIPAARYHAFYRTRQIPPGAQIWIGRYDGAGPWPTQYAHREIRIARADEDPPNAYVAAFSVGYVAFVYWGHEVQSGAIVHLAHRMQDFLLPVWPALNPVSWPPRGVLGADGVNWAATNLIAMT